MADMGFRRGKAWRALAASALLTICGALAACGEAGEGPRVSGASGSSGAAARAPGAPAASRAYFPVQRCINLANALNAPNEGEWGYRIEEEHLRIIAAAGFDTIRVLIDWHSHTETGAPYRVDPAYFVRIDEVIRQGFASGLNVIIDMHDYLDLYSTPRAHRDRTLAIWRQIAERYADWPQELIFEPVNEPRDALSGAVWEALAADLVRTIRVSNPTRTIILGGDNWSSLAGLLRLRLPDDPYLVATFHYYTPHEFTHQGADWHDDPPPVGLRWGQERERAVLRAQMDEAAAWAAANRTPVFLGEFGVFRAADLSDRAAWTRAVREGAEVNMMPWCYFDFTAGFDAYDRETGRWIPEIAAALNTAGSAPTLRR